MPTLEMAHHRRAERLVDGPPQRNDVAERLDHKLRVVAEVADGIAGRPATRILQRLGEVPVVERRHRLDTPGVQAVDQAPVEVEALLVNGAGAVRDDARPRGRGPESVL